MTDTNAEVLHLRAAQLREGLAWSQSLAKDFNGALDAYSARLTDLQLAVASVAQRSQACSSQALRTAQKNIKLARDEVEEMLGHLDTARQVEATILAGPRSNLAAFLKALGRLEASNQFLEKHRQVPTADSALQSASALLRDAMRLALDDFTATLKHHAVVPSASGHLFGGAPSRIGGESGLPAAQPLLPMLATPRVGSKLGEGQEDDSVVVIPALVAGHLRALAEVRRGLVEKALAGLLNAASAGEEARGSLFSRIQECQLLKGRTQYRRPYIPILKYCHWCARRWVAALKLLVGIVKSERAAAQAVWPPGSSETEQAFDEVVSRSVVAATHAGAFIVASKRTPEKVFGLLDMQEQVEAALARLAPTLEGTPAAGFLADFTQLAAMLRQEARATLEEFEASIGRDTVKHPPADGTVHPLAAYTLSFLKRLFAYEATLDTLFGNAANEAAALSAARRGEALERRRSEGMDEGVMTAVQGAVGHMLRVLLDNLETKARTYKNKALAALFLMNNVHYIVKAVESSEALSCVGQDWIERHKDLIETYGEEYQESSWGPLMALVGDGVNGEGRAWAKEKAGIKERWREINTALTELRDAQCTWTIPDPALKANMKDAVAEDFLPLYKMFMEKYNPEATPFTKNPEKYIRWSVAEVQRLIAEDLFEARERDAVIAASATKGAALGTRSSGIPVAS
ncbi:Exo70 exocyst complex subunit [Coccomyxa subellipsoidea C-169]|uniref:Exocyst subunit Exo70 family protein n=1 Tax=Coccomyxa subellipsoidea (strain C-169) TaxID=574566 RepID=I0YQJ0_COCSC|nr:Exo70 exocyst complex subunit [Coccomyxa subellipsoidea C-169]EIE20659.1 Exo70 exocyst complex subunit [Coccomyxa subellipsoidea C-169]|eukprot:XP_005645203.1 Exo70 exocyst complex subunit [Coccomyxa subellipsoidea C-169]